jgi:predicted nuclease with TOPRIM domain
MTNEAPVVKEETSPLDETKTKEENEDTMSNKKKSPKKGKKVATKKVSAKKAKKTKAEIALARTELYVEFVELQRDGTSLESKNNRMQALEMEAALLNEQIQKLKNEIPTRNQTLQAKYAELKKSLGVPEDHELDLKTGAFQAKTPDAAAKAAPKKK